MGLPADSFSASERKLLAPARRALAAMLRPLVRLLVHLRVAPNAVSLSQVPLAVVIVALIPVAPAVALALYGVTLALDGIDGALARAAGRASRYGALVDQYSDHAREVIVVAGLAAHGALHPAVAVLYGLAYPGANLTLYLCNLHRLPLPIALKTYVTFYPALAAYLWLGVNVLDAAAGVAVCFMVAAIVQGLWRLRGAMG